MEFCYYIRNRDRLDDFAESISREALMPEKGFHYHIGDYDCIIFSDGTITGQGMETEEVFGLNCLLIDSGNEKILIDTGGGGGFQSTAGRLSENLEAEGIKRADIDRIVVTHGHIDHVGGCFDSRGMPVFPNARYITSESEWEFWLSKPADDKFETWLFSTARKRFLPIRAQFELVDDGAEILPGINIILAPGHTPGNIIVDISSGGKRLLCIGDIIHSQQEFLRPHYLSLFDISHEQALRTREKILTDVVKSGTLVYACHFPFPGFGYMKNIEGVFTWQPF